MFVLFQSKDKGILTHHFVKATNVGFDVQVRIAHNEHGYQVPLNGLRVMTKLTGSFHNDTDASSPRSRVSVTVFTSHLKR